MESPQKDIEPHTTDVDLNEVTGMNGDHKGTGEVLNPADRLEVFQETATGVNFRTVGWPRAAGIFLKGEHFSNLCR